MNPDIDAHRRMASKMYGVPEEEVTKEQRSVGKTANFALQYGCGIPKLQDQLKSVLNRDVSVEEAKMAYEAWHKTHHMISKRMGAFRDQDNPIYVLQSPLGRKMQSPNPKAKTKRNAWGHMQPPAVPLYHTNGTNWPIQSAGRDLLAEAADMVWCLLVAPNPRVKALHLVHDEILLEVPEDMVEEAVQIVTECMTCGILQQRYLGDIPLAAEVLTGHRWSECH